MKLMFSAVTLKDSVASQSGGLRSEEHSSSKSCDSSVIELLTQAAATSSKYYAFFFLQSHVPLLKENEIFLEDHLQG